MTQPNTPIEPPKPGAFPFAQLRKALSQLAGVPVMDPRRPIDEDGQTGDDEQAWIFARPTVRRSIGVDEMRSDADATYTAQGVTYPDPAPEQLTTSVGGHRVQTVSLRAEVIDEDLDPVDVLERVRMGVRSVTGYGFLTALGLAISSLEPITTLGQQKTVNGRQVLVAVMDIRFGWAANVSTFHDEVGTIDTVNESEQFPGTPATIVGNVTPS